MKKKIRLTPLSISVVLFSFLVLFPHKIQAQIGGDYTFAFLRQSPSARLTALGTSQIALRDNDLALAYANPALLDSEDHNALIFNHNFLLGGVGTGSFGYGYHVEKWATTLQAHVQYMNYGNFQKADEFGNIQGTFRANEYAVILGAGKKINERLAAGLNAKFITSQLEAYSASGVAFDLAGSYWHEEKKIRCHSI
ncbi:MAG: PorV/PorQ family protein [Saprospiraceae bacterium]|nr:PorV/PorQ family protein [Saprospiraceae bacterium]